MAATDNFVGDRSRIDSPARNAFAVSPHNTNEMAFVTRGIYVGGAGDLKVTTIGGDTVTFSAVPAGVILPVCAKIVFATGTTATLILGLY